MTIVTTQVQTHHTVDISATTFRRFWRGRVMMLQGRRRLAPATLGAVVVVAVFLLLGVEGQRQRSQVDIDREETARVVTQVRIARVLPVVTVTTTLTAKDRTSVSFCFPQKPKVAAKSATAKPTTAIGTEFPYNRGETPIFNFDSGDEALLNTVPELVKSLHLMAGFVSRHTRIAKGYADAFSSCPHCRQP